MATQVTRRTALRGGAAAVSAAAAAALAGCGPLGGDRAPAAGEQLAGVTVRFWARGTPSANDAEETARVKVLEDFNAHNPHGIKVVAEEFSVPEARLVSAIVAGTPPDMVIRHQVFLVDFFTMGALVDVDAELKGDAEWRRARASAYPNILGGLTYRGKLFAIPSHNSYFLLYFNPVLLRRAGLAAPPPRTWSRDAFVDYLKKASRPADDVSGYDSYWDHQHWAMFLLNDGATTINKEHTKLLVDTPESIETVEWELGLVKQGLSRPHDGSPTGGAREKLHEGKVVFQLAVPNRVRRWRQQGGVDFGTGFYPLGARNGARVNYGFGSALGTAVFKNQDPRKVQAALQAGLWHARPDSGMTFARDGAVPPSYKHIVDAAEFKAEWQKDAEFWPFFEALPGFVPEPGFPKYWDAMAHVTEQLRAIWADRTSVRDGLKEAQRLAQQILDESLRG